MSGRGGRASPRGIFPKYPFDHRHRFTALEVAGDCQNRVVGGVVRPEKIGDVVEGRVGQMLHRADQRMMERMLRGKAQLLQFLPARSIRLIVDAPAPFVLNNVALRVEFDLRQCRQHATHAITFQPQRHRKLVRRHRLVIVGALEPRGSVQRSTSALHQLEMFVRLNVLRSLEQHVFKEMGESGAVQTFVGRPDVIPEIDGNNGSGVVLRQDHLETIGQGVALDRNLHILNWMPCALRRNPALQMCDKLTLAFHAFRVDFSFSKNRIPGLQ